MPYLRRRRSITSLNRGMAAGVRRLVPRLSPGTSSLVRLEKAGIDVLPRLVSYNFTALAENINGTATFTSTELDLAFNPMKYFYATGSAEMVDYKK